jgi:hypothetical protein
VIAKWGACVRELRGMRECVERALLGLQEECDGKQMIRTFYLAIVASLLFGTWGVMGVPRASRPSRPCAATAIAPRPAIR